MLSFLMPEDVEREFETIIDAVKARDSRAILDRAHPDILTDSVEQQLADAFAFVPNGEHIETVRAGYRSFSLRSTSQSYSDHHTAYQLEFSDGWAWVEISLRREGDDLLIRNLRITKLERDLRKIHRFDFAATPLKQKIVAGSMVFAALFVLATFITVIASRRRLKRPILWVIIVLIGVGKLQLDWTTGAISVQYLSAGVGGGFSRGSEFESWVASSYFPLFAIIFWVRKLTGTLATK